MRFAQVGCLITFPAISLYESGKNTTRVDSLVLLAEFFNVSLDYLIDLSDNPYPLHDKNDKPYVLQLSRKLTKEQVKLLQRFAIDITNSQPFAT